MKLIASSSPSAIAALHSSAAADEQLFALWARADEGAALIHDLAGTIRTFRYIASSYGDSLPSDDPQKAAKIAQLEERLTQLEQLKDLLGPLAEGN